MNGGQCRKKREKKPLENEVGSVSYMETVYHIQTVGIKMYGTE